MRSHMPRWRTSKDFDAPQWALSTVRAEREPEGQEVEERVVICIELRLRGARRQLRLTECTAAGREQTSPTAIGEEPIVTDTHEALGKHMEQEAARELGEGKREGP